MSEIDPGQHDPGNQTPVFYAGGFLKPGEKPPTDVDYSAFNDSQVMKPVQQVQADLQKIVDEAQMRERNIVELEEKLKFEKKCLKGIVEDVLPRALKDAGFGEVGFPLADGTLVKVNSKVECHVLADRREEAWDWLEANGQGDILKREVTIPFLVKEGEDAKKLQTELQNKYLRSVSCDRRAEPSTLKATLVKMMERQSTTEGAVVVPRELFGIREMDVAVFKAPRR
jgi:hypothetical protein